MPDDEGGAGARRLDHGRDVGRAIVQVHFGKRAAARADAARLRPQHLEPGRREARRDRIEILGAAAERGQQHDRRAVAVPALAVDQHLDRDLAARDGKPRRHRSPGSARSSQSAITLAMSSLFFSSIIMWPLPWTPTSGSRMKVLLTPAWAR